MHQDVETPQSFQDLIESVTFCAAQRSSDDQRESDSLNLGVKEF